MHFQIFELPGIVVTPWKLVGYAGVLLFAGRWIVQMIATGRRGRPVIPALFWMMSAAGSVLLLIYFTWGRNDSVGLLSNLFPLTVAVYNLMLHRKVTASGERSATQRDENDAAADERDTDPVAH